LHFNLFKRPEKFILDHFQLISSFIADIYIAPL